MRRDHRHVYIEWAGTSRPRVEVIRELHASGVPVADIARRLGVPYQTVYMAVRAAHRSDMESVIARPPDQPSNVDAVLLGCVSQKQATPMAAKDLYRSELFRRRRLWAEASGKPWWIVSAEYGLVDPDEVIAPYDTRIARRPLEDRRRLAEHVASHLEARLGALAGRTLELHAGDEYFQVIAPALRLHGAKIVRPLEGLRFGEQLQWR